MAANFIPGPDEEFDVFCHAFVPFVLAHGATLGVAPTAVTAIDTFFNGDWTDAFADHKAKNTDAEAATAAKESARLTLTKMIRPMAATMQVHPAMTDEMRAEAHLPIHDKTPTRAAVPTTRPLVAVDASQRLQHTISWRDEATPNLKAKPAGVRGAEIWYAVAPTPPGDPDEYHFSALDTSTPYLLHHDAADAGKQAHYLLRWVNTRNEAGPWSETASATIGA